MKDQFAIQNFLNKKLKESQENNKKFSLRAFASKCGVTPSALSEILNGKRKITLKMTQKILTSLKVSPAEKSEVLKYFKSETEDLSQSQIKKIGIDYIKLREDEFEIISKWIYFATLSLMSTSTFKNTVEDVAEKLGVRTAIAADVVARLERMKLVERDAKGKYNRTSNQIETSDDIPSYTIRKAHLADLDLVRESIQFDPVNIRDMSSITFAADPEKISKAKDLIRKFQDDMAELMQSRATSQVYKLTTHLFPITNGRKKSL